MQIARTATPGAYRQRSAKVRFGSRGKSGSLFIPDVDPLNIRSGADRVRDSVKGIPGHAVNSPNTCIHKNFHQEVRYFLLGHTNPFSSSAAKNARSIRLGEHARFQTSLVEKEVEIGRS
jgi:hypothetical protein